MDASRLIAIRKQAEKAVDAMPEGELKVKAFEVILAHLLGGGQPASVGSRPSPEPEPPRKKGSTTRDKTTIGGRILVLRDEGFFKAQKTIGQVREELRAHGWHYPVTTLSGRMQSLVRRAELRRERVKEGKNRTWKYSNP